MTSTLADGGRIAIRGFGSFSLNYRLSRIGRNPKTGAVVEIPAKAAHHFKMGGELQERVNKKTYQREIALDVSQRTCS